MMVAVDRKTLVLLPATDGTNISVQINRDFLPGMEPVVCAGRRLLPVGIFGLELRSVSGVHSLAHGRAVSLEEDLTLLWQ